jgi:hypothetical protein
MLTDDFAIPPELAASEFSEKFLPILAMLETLDGQLPGKSIDCNWSVSPFVHAGRG